jgi:hypothetical protein
MARKSMHGWVSHAHSVQPNQEHASGVNQNRAARLERFARVGELIRIQIHGAVMSERQDPLPADRKGIDSRILISPRHEGEGDIDGGTLRSSGQGYSTSGSVVRRSLTSTVVELLPLSA